MSPKKKPATRAKPTKKRAAPVAGKKKKTGGPVAKKKKTGGAGKTPLKKKAAKKVRPEAPAVAPAENPRAKQLAQRIARLVLDKKANDVLILDVRGKASYADYMVLASGESDRQVSAMADNVLSQLKADGHRAVGSEGHETGNWVLIDFGEVVAHLFNHEVRGFYDLEGLWADAPREKVA